MQSRMDKYQTNKKVRFERTQKNTKLYEDVYEDIYKDTSYKNMQVIDSVKEINIGRLKDMLENKYDTRQYRTLKNYSEDDIDFEDKMDYPDRRQKIYDINEIINEAKNKRAFIEEAKEKQKYMDFSERNKKTDHSKYQEMEKEEKELEELINTMAISRQSLEDTKDTQSDFDMFSELKGSENTIVTNPIKTNFEVESDEINKPNERTSKLDKTFYTDSNMFTKNDFEDFSTLTREISSGQKKYKILLIILLILIILGTILFFVIKNYTK